MEYKRTLSGRLYNDTHAQCLHPNPETHAVHAILPRESFNKHPNNNFRNHCRDCQSLESAHYRNLRMLSGRCCSCGDPAIYGGFCEWHYFRNKASVASRANKREGIYDDAGRDEVASYILSIYPENELCPYCGVAITRSGGSVSDGIKNSHQNNASLDAVLPERGHIIGNLIWVCGRCNRDKSNLSLEEIRNRGGWHERVLEIMERHK